MARDPIPTWFFAVVVVQHADLFLLVHERKHGQTWYLPAGRVELGESLIAAAERETLEETGVRVRIESVIRVEHSPFPDSARLRVIFFARPVDNTAPKVVPDDESLGAAWVGREELSNYQLRAGEVRELIEYVSAGGPMYPVSLIQHEGMPLLAPASQSATSGTPAATNRDSDAKPAPEPTTRHQ